MMSVTISATAVTSICVRAKNMSVMEEKNAKTVTRGRAVWLGL